MQISLTGMILIITQLTIAVIDDMRFYKVKNSMILFFLAAGVIFHAFSAGQHNLYLGILGLAAPFIILLPLYIMKMLGAGDIKLFCSIGFIVGIKGIIYSIMYSYLFGFVAAIIIMLTRDNFQKRSKKLFTYLKSCFLTMSVLPYEEPNIKSDGRIHFTIPIAFGTLAAILI